MTKISEAANLYVASHRALYLIETNCHWLTVGNYADHLLFERLYQQAAEDSDLVAEKMIGIFGESSVSMKLQSEFLSKLLEKYQGDDLLELCLKLEKDIIAYSRQFYNALEKADQLTLGVDDMIMSLSSNRETACYLLQQVLKNKD